MAKNSVEKKKGALVGVSIAIIVIAVLLSVLGVALLVASIKMVVSGKLIGILFIVLSGILSIAGLAGVGVGVYYVWLGGRTVATKGSIKEGNIAMNGTVNMVKCSNCGTAVNEGDEFCPNCGASLSETKKCPSCGATNKASSKRCTACGAELE